MPAWGLMLREGGAEEYATTAPVARDLPRPRDHADRKFGINLFGDLLRDVLDPKLRDAVRARRPPAGAP